MTFSAAPLGGRGPKYLRIADVLRAEIQRRDLDPGSRLPAETDLADRFEVSLPTLRQGLSLLRAEGLIESRHGIGTFVREHRRSQRRSRNRYGRARGDNKLLSDSLEHRITFAGRAPVPDAVAEAMGVETATEVVVRRRHLHSKVTGDLEEIGASYIPVEFAAGTFIEEPAVVPKALFLCIEDQALKKYSRARDAWITRPADPNELDLFKLATGTPVMHLIHTAWAEDGTVLEVSESIWPADKVIVIDEYEITQHSEPPTSLSDI